LTTNYLIVFSLYTRKEKPPEEALYQFSEFIPKDNFYRILKDELDLSYLPSITKEYLAQFKTG